jgi:carboxyl-terminal processing protease
MVGVLNRHGDQHSEFLNQEEADPLRVEIRQQFGGIGVRIGLEGEPPRLTIMGPPDPGSPAALENLRSGDHILSIDGIATAGMNMTEVLKRIRGLPDTKVLLSIQQGGDAQSRSVELVRKVINIESVLGDRRDDEGSWRFQLEADPRIAHIRIASFGERTAGELERVLENVIAHGTKAVVLDLRNDAGGSLDAAVEVCQMLLPAGMKIVETRGQDNQVRASYSSIEDGPFLTLPIAVLVNQDSASAAEIVAACLQDNDRAAIAGQRSYGKGTVQQLIPMQSGKSLLKLTWASFWRPSGDKIHRGTNGKEDETWGVVPDAGLERRLTEQEFEAFLKYRSERDRIEPVPSEKGDSQAEISAPVEFVDEQLQLAVKHLQSALGGETR